jgi:iron-sulfur cluster repair protein YtfE (RIC family)
MSQALPQVAHRHHEQLLGHVNAMPELADQLLTAKAEDAVQALDEMSAFLTGTLVPHIDAAERTLYPELERMFQNRHSMTPMRREHTEVRRLVEELAKLTAEVDASRLTLGRTLALRRVIFHLYSMLKIHLAEEEAYLRIVEHGVTPDVADALAAALEHPVARQA